MRNKTLAAALALVIAPGCALHARTVGSHDEAVDIAQAHAEAERYRAESNAAIVKALIEALTRLAPSPKGLTPGLAICVDSDGVTVRVCEGRDK